MVQLELGELLAIGKNEKDGGSGSLLVDLHVLSRDEEVVAAFSGGDAKPGFMAASGGAASWIPHRVFGQVTVNIGLGRSK